MNKRAICVLLLAGWSAAPTWARDELVTSAGYDGQRAPYILTTSDGAAPTHAVVLMPGGSGNLNPRLQDGKLAFGFSGNFLIRSRALFADQRFVAASTDATTSPARMTAIMQDLERRYPGVAVYILGTSNSTGSTMALAAPLDGRAAGFVHSSSLNRIAGFDARGFKSRHLIVYHRMDACRATRPSASDGAQRSYGIEVIAIEGGRSTGDDCEAYAHHGYYGVERETVDRIKSWIVRAP